MELVGLCITIVAGSLALGGAAWGVGRWVCRRLRRQPDPKPATEERLARLDDRVQHLQETLEGLKEVFNHHFGIADRAAEQLVATSDEERLALLAQATKAQREGRYADAVDMLRSCFRPGLPLKELAALHNLIGNVYMYMGEQAKAEPHYQEVLAAAQEMDDDQARAIALGNLGLVYADRSDFDKAEQHYKKALAVSRKISNRLAQAAVLGNLGNVYRRRGDLDKAEEHHKKALAIDEEIGNRLGQASDLGNLGSMCAERAELEQAERYHKAALAMHKDIGDRLGEATALGNLGGIYLLWGDPHKAEEFHKEALELHREVGNPVGEAKQLAGLAVVHLQGGNADEALRYLREARRIFAEVGAPAEVKKTDELIGGLEAASRPEPKQNRGAKKPPPKKP